MSSALQQRAWHQTDFLVLHCARSCAEGRMPLSAGPGRPSESAHWDAYPARFPKLSAITMQYRPKTAVVTINCQQGQRISRSEVSKCGPGCVSANAPWVPLWAWGWPKAKLSSNPKAEPQPNRAPRPQRRRSPRYCSSRVPCPAPTLSMATYGSACKPVSCATAVGKQHGAGDIGSAHKRAPA